MRVSTEHLEGRNTESVTCSVRCRAAVSACNVWMRLVASDRSLVSLTLGWRVRVLGEGSYRWGVGVRVLGCAPVNPKSRIAVSRENKYTHNNTVNHRTQ